MNRTNRLGIGIDVGGTKIAAVIGTSDGNALADIRMETPKGREPLLAALHQVVFELLSQADCDPCRLAGVGVGLPGTVSGDRRSVRWVPNLPEIDGMPLASLLEEQTGVRTVLGNDGQLSLKGEHWLGAARGCADVVMITLGTGIGGAIMAGGKIVEGANGTAGSMGWLVMDLNDPGDKRNGWWERKVSGSAIDERSGRLHPPMTGRDMFAAAERGEPEAVRLLEQIGSSLGAGAANLASLLNPEVIIFGGGVSAHLPLLLPTMKKALSKFASPSARNTPIVQAGLQHNAGMFGAMRLVFELP